MWFEGVAGRALRLISYLHSWSTIHPRGELFLLTFEYVCVYTTPPNPVPTRLLPTQSPSLLQKTQNRYQMYESVPNLWLKPPPFGAKNWTRKDEALDEAQDDQSEAQDGQDEAQHEQDDAPDAQNEAQDGQNEPK